MVRGLGATAVVAKIVGLTGSRGAAGGVAGGSGCECSAGADAKVAWYLDLGLDGVNGVASFHFEGDGLAGECLDKDLHLAYVFWTCEDIQLVSRSRNACCRL